MNPWEILSSCGIEPIEEIVQFDVRSGNRCGSISIIDHLTVYSRHLSLTKMFSNLRKIILENETENKNIFDENIGDN